MKSASILALAISALGFSSAQAQLGITVDLGEEFEINSPVQFVTHTFTIKDVPAGEEDLIAVLYQDEELQEVDDSPVEDSLTVTVVTGDSEANVTVPYERRQTVIQGEFFAECVETGYSEELLKLGQHRSAGAKVGDVHSAWAIPLVEGDNEFSFCYSMRGGIVGNLNDVIRLKIQRRDPEAFIPLKEARFMEFVNGTDFADAPVYEFNIVGNYQFDPTMYIVTIATGVVTAIILVVCSVDVAKNGCAIQEDEDEK